MNHSMDSDSPTAKEMREFAKSFEGNTEKIELGATGRFPGGKLDHTDEGELAFAVRTDEKRELIYLDFGKPVAWLSLTPQLANDLANSLLKHARAMGHTAVVNLYNSDGKKPTVEELEKMLTGEGGGIQILPNGEIRST